jgi:short-subunit dehydrogenase
VEIIVADLVQSGSKDKLEDVLVDLSKYDISVVVNNAGVDILDQYLDLSIETITNLIQINCFALAAINYIFLPRHQQRTLKTGKRCSIINVSSVAGTFYTIKVKCLCRFTTSTQPRKAT